MSKSKFKKMAKANNGKKKALAAPSFFTDLALTLSSDGNTLTCTISPDAQWAGIQKYVDPTSNDGALAIWEAQRNYSTPPGSGQTTNCPTQGSGHYRGWTSDFNYDIHYSNWVVI